MKISFNPDQLFDLAGNPLVSGRVSFFLKDSDTLANTYYRDGNNFIDGQNPVVLDNSGSFVDTVFLDVAIYDIVVEKLTDGVYHQINNFEFGFEMPDVKNDTVVDGMAGLAQANPELGSVTVVGYDSNVFCGARTYIWDANCTDAADGGCIVSSQTTETGRWLLLSDLREMPSTYYGVAPGHEANIAAFITYPSVVGTYGIWMPPVPRFLKGEYTSTGTQSTTKTLSFDNGAKFTQLTFTCPSAEVTANTSSYVADFRFTAEQEVAESRWFRTVRAFWACGAKVLHQSSTNYFVDNSISVGLGVANCRICGNPVTMTGVGQLMLTNVEVAPKSLSTSWYVNFNNMPVSDRYFADANWDIGSITQGHHQYASISNGAKLLLDDFDDTNVYVLFAADNGLTDLNLQGRGMGTISASMPFTTIRNAVVQYAHFTHSVALMDTTIGELYSELGSVSITAVRSTFTLVTNLVDILDLTDSTFTLESPLDSKLTGITATNSTLVLNSRITRDSMYDHGVGKIMQLKNCNVLGGSLDNGSMVITDCTLSNCGVHLFAVGSPGNYYLNGRFERNLWLGSSQLSVTPGLDANNSRNVYEVAPTYLRIVDNVFETSVAGIAIPFWAQDMEHRFLKGGITAIDWTHHTCTWGYAYEYRGNSGNCPQAVTEGSLYTYGDILYSMDLNGTGNSDANEVHHVCENSPIVKVFALPVTPSDMGSTVDYHWVIDNGAKATIPYKNRAVIDVTAASGMVIGSCGFPMTCFTPVCAWDKSQPNDLFTCYLAGVNVMVGIPIVEYPAIQ